MFEVAHAALTFSIDYEFVRWRWKTSFDLENRPFSALEIIGTQVVLRGHTFVSTRSMLSPREQQHPTGARPLRYSYHTPPQILKVVGTGCFIWETLHRKSQGSLLGNLSLIFVHRQIIVSWMKYWSYWSYWSFRWRRESRRE